MKNATARLTLPLLTAALSACCVAAPAAFAGEKEAVAKLAKAKKPAGPRVKILGFSTFPRVGIPSIQAKPGKKITQCYNGYGGQREINAVWQGKGIAKRTKMGVALWGGGFNSPFQSEPSNEDVMKDNGFKWKYRASKVHQEAYGFSFAGGPFGPQSIDGTWTFKVLLKGKVAARKKVVVECEA